MISFRYHIVSIVSVFLALAVGVALGGGPLKGEVDNTLVDQVQADRAVKAELRSEITGLKGGNTFNDEFAETIAPGLLGQTLAGRVVTVVALPGASQGEVTALGDMVTTAGGTVGNTSRPTMPSRCSSRSVCVSIFCEMSGTRRLTSLKRSGPPDSVITISMLHLSPTLSSTLRTGQPSTSRPAALARSRQSRTTSTISIGVVNGMSMAVTPG